ncbi:hypothetical protein [Neptuniibacter caesariensis]|uniref:Uncharacterized protein n=1 Tax=Neptuniibacter caesariensis TaxID=207954 RepID=A0A7U8C605_NEPCE|nr:hypothetical protein [Neptuniibacter caesariensis]EAR62153.1 hypothetical protein MED92_10619 [Oceanospirillum sp. MED92] [Neptuniibacter caesariensis]
MISEQLEKLWDEARQAHEKLQAEHAKMDPIIGVSQHMRKQGIPADVMMIDHAVSGKRIIIILHDHYPQQIRYQLAWIEKDPANEFIEIDFAQVDANRIFTWMVEYFI